MDVSASVIKLFVCISLSNTISEFKVDLDKLKILPPQFKSLSDDLVKVKKKRTSFMILCIISRI